MTFIKWGHLAKKCVIHNIMSLFEYLLLLIKVPKTRLSEICYTEVVGPSLSRKGFFLRWCAWSWGYKMIFASVFSVTICSFLVSGYAVFVEPWSVGVAEYTIESERIPDAFDGKKIALITDMHHGKPHTYNLLGKVVQMTREQSPDLILLGGDYSRERPAELEACFAKLTELDAPLGVYAVSGNHDYWDLPRFRKAVREAGIELLQNDAVRLEESGDGILLVGVKDFWCDKPSVTGLRRELAESDFTVLLSHNADFYDTMEQEDRARIDLMLSGHTHGGQITLFGLYAPAKTSKAKYISGHVKSADDRTDIIISNGIGTTSLPVRFFARPQIVLVTLKKKHCDGDKK